LVQSAEEVYLHPFAEKIKPEAPDRASIWTDTNLYNELGIPAIKIGPRGRRIGPRNEEIEIDVKVKAAQIYTRSWRWTSVAGSGQFDDGASERLRLDDEGRLLFRLVFLLR
jgi:hypothetical protein